MKYFVYDHERKSTNYHEFYKGKLLWEYGLQEIETSKFFISDSEGYYSDLNIKA